MSIRPVYVFEKFPSEEFTQSVDFADSLGVGESITAGAADAIERLSGSDATADVIDGAASVSTTKVVYAVKGGAPGTRYLISVRATINNGNVYEQWIEMLVPAEVI